MRVAFLGHDQPICGMVRPAGGFLTRDDAERLLAEFAAERISNKVIRAFPPGSAFRSLRGVPIEKTSSPTKIKLPPVEVGNTVFREPTDETWILAHRAAIRSVRTRAWMSYRALFRVSARSSGANPAARTRPTQPPAPVLLAESS